MKKNNKGFSLVELIIVIAIMVALIAVLAPSYVKYVQKSRVSAYENACEDFIASVKEAYADPDSNFTQNLTITISKPAASQSFASCCSSTDQPTVLSSLLNRANAGGKKLQAVTNSASTYTIVVSGGNVVVSAVNA